METILNTMNKPYRYHVLYSTSKGIKGQRSTNSISVADRWSIIYYGVIYEDLRYEGRIRLYNYVNRIR